MALARRRAVALLPRMIGLLAPSLSVLDPIISRCNHAATFSSLASTAVPNRPPPAPVGGRRYGMAAARPSWVLDENSPQISGMQEIPKAGRLGLWRPRPSHRALLVDAAGTLVEPAQSVAEVYLGIGKKYGVTLSEQELLRRYRWAYSQPWSSSFLRYVGDGRPFWQFIVSHSTGCDNPAYFEEVYSYYETAEAWRLTDPRAGDAFAALRASGVRVAVVSNFDTRLRSLLKTLGCDTWFDALAVSAEVQAEKPNPVLFLHACDQLGVDPKDAVHVGDDRRNDLWGARDAGCDAWLWGEEVRSFKQVAERMGVIPAGSNSSGL